MKKLYSLLKAAVVAGALLPAGQLSAQCAMSNTTGLHGYGCGYGDQIDAFVLDNVAASNSGCSSNAYTFYSSPVWNLTIGNTYTWSSVVGNGSYPQGFAIWIDYNNDGFFTTNEQVANSVPALTHSGTFTVPFTASPGTSHRMRLRCDYYATIDATGDAACETYGSPNYNFYYGETEDYNVTLISPTPCTGTPSANYVVTPTAAVCPNSSVPLSLGNTYTVGDITYQWQSSTTSSVGPFTAIPNATMMTYVTPGLTSTVWYQTVITCTNGMGSVLANVGVVNVEPTITDTVPYHESFEGIAKNNQLPNCTWTSPTMSTTALTYVASSTLGRNPRTGTKFASFYYFPTGAKYFYTNGIYLQPGITYSAAMWYQTEYYGYTNWTDLSIMLGTSQTSTGLQTIASTSGPAVSNVYKKLDNTFTVSSPGVYYVAIRATSSSGSASYLSWDDLSVTIPCDLNTPSVTVSASNATICSGSGITMTAAGADTYLWNTGATSSQITFSPNMSGTYSVTGTSTLTGCSATQVQQVTVNDRPSVGIFANKTRICSGTSANLTAHGNAASYLWSNTTTNAVNVVSPSATTSYSVVGTGANGCSSTAMITVSVDPLPTIVATADRNPICVGEQANLSGTGGVSYQWDAKTGAIVANPANVSPQATTAYTLTGTDANGCSSTAILSLVVDACTGLNTFEAPAGFRIYPNPTSGLLMVESDGADITGIEVTDVTGRLIISTSGAEIVNISNAAAGVYYIKVKTGQTVEVVKVIKN